MAGIYIPGMENPKNCEDCPFGWYTRAGDKFCLTMIHGWQIKCPLIPVPDHGRLIDKSVICKECRRVAEEYDGIYPDCTYCPVHIAQTIIPADTEAQP